MALPSPPPSRSDGRCVFTVTLQPAFYAAIREHCRAVDEPMTVWARRAFEQALSTSSDDDHIH